MDDRKPTVPRRGWRDALYGRIRLSVRAMNVIIGVIVLMLITAVAVGILTGR